MCTIEQEQGLWDELTFYLNHKKDQKTFFLH